MSVQLIFIYCCTISIILCSNRGGNNTDGFPQNNFSAFDSPPIFINQTKNAKLFLAGNQSGTNSLLLHLYGTPYEMGFASGTILKQSMTEFITQMTAYMEEQINQISFFKKMPEKLKSLIAKYGIEIALDLTYLVTKKYTTPSYYEELQGMADGSGIDYKMLRRVQLVGEATKAACSMYGAWGSATKNNKTLQFRALDWDIQGPPHNYPLITVYHFDESILHGHSFVNIGFVGWIGVVTGMSSKQMAISEIGVSFPDNTFGKESRFGNPFTFLLRDILQFDNTLEQSIQRIKNSHRTCNLILGVGDGKEEAQTFRGFQYSHSVATVITDENLLPKNDSWHAPFKNVVYWGMDWIDETYSGRLHDQIDQFWGQITVENTMSNIIAKTQTGDLHVAVYDLTDNFLYVSMYRRDDQPDDGAAGKEAYSRQYIKLDMESLFREQE